ncbi:MAG TPA: hypothetical protein VIG29_15890, partial [Vicinamibacteria bacterium]
MRNGRECSLVLAGCLLAGPVLAQERGGQEIALTLGTKGQKGRDGGKLFDRPTDIAWLPDGTFFISDGYGGTRVAKFAKDGTFIKDWGQPPKDRKNPGPNEFHTVHSIAVSDDRRLFVVDR